MGEYAPLAYKSDYIQTQESAGCGRHALNNLLGGTYFTKTDGSAYTFNELESLGKNISVATPIDLQRICGYLQSRPNHALDEKNACPASEYYNIEVLQFSLQIAGYKTEALYRTKEEGLDSFQKFVTDTNGTLGYIINYNKGHWVALHKNGPDYTYKNSVSGALPPTPEQKAALITQFKDSKIKIPSTIATSQSHLTDEQALALAIQNSMKQADTTITTISPGVGTTAQYNTVADYFAAYGVNIVSVLSVRERSADVALAQLRLENPLYKPFSSKPTGPKPPQKPLGPKPPQKPLGPKPDLLNFFTGNTVSRSFIDTLPTIKSTDTEFDFLTKLHLVENDKIKDAAKVLYEDAGVFTATLPGKYEPWRVTQLYEMISGTSGEQKFNPSQKPMLEKYLTLMADTILPSRIAALKTSNPAVSTDIHLGAQIQREIAEMEAYIIFLKGRK